jgi:imidazolonepropionase-like amidohydrolase
MRLREVLDDARLFKSEEGAYRRNQLRELATSRLDLEALQDVLSRKIPLVIRVARAADILAVLRFAKEEKVNVALVGAEEGWLVAAQIAEAKVPVLVNPMANLPDSFEARNARSDNVTLLAKAGVKVAVTTEASHNASGLRFHLGNAVRAGLPHDLALRAGTLTPAEIFGADKKYGSIAQGKIANIVVWTGDPFEPSSWAETILVRGEPQPTHNRQTRLRDKYKVRLGL